MTNATFCWQNLFDIGTLSWSSQHSNFPAINVRHRHHSRVWRPKYGAGSGWGTFVIAAGVNDKIDFEETVAIPLVATLTAGIYDADTLATEIQTRLIAAGASTYTIEYLDGNNKFKLTSNGAGGGGIFNLLWNSGANSATSVGSTIGFNIASDDTGSLTYTADYIRIHSEEWLKTDLGSAQNVLAFAFKKHSFLPTATVRIQGHSSDSWGTPNVDQLLTLSADITIFYWTSAQSQQWWRIYMKDVDNPAGYIEMGRAFLGGHFSPSVNCHRNYAAEIVDPTDILYSDGGQMVSNKKTKFKRTGYSFEHAVAADLTSFEEIWDSLGRSGDFFFTKDRDKASTTTRYVHFLKDLKYKHIAREELFNIDIVIEDLR